MLNKTYYAGQDIDAPCGRCKQETRHLVMTVTNGIPEMLICGACKSIHKFRADKPKAEPAARAPRSASAPRPAPSASRFHELMNAERAGAVAKPYSVQVRWEEGAWMDHPAFGLGKVQKRAGRKVDVLFKDGLKTLLSA
jgi:hypothetical protein